MAEIDLRVRLSNVRLSWPHITEPQVQKGEDNKEKAPRYNCEFILTPDNPAWAHYFQVLNHVANQKWKEKAPAVLQFLQNQPNKRAYGVGHEKIQKSTMQPYPSYVGMVFLKAASERPPQIFDANGALVPFENSMAWKELARKMYGGCRVNAVIKPWCWDNKQGGSGVSNDFVAIQFLADDEPFGEGTADATDLMTATPQAQANPFGAMPGALAAGPAWPVPGVPTMPGATAPAYQPHGMGGQMPPAPFPGVAGTPAAFGAAPAARPGMFGG